MISSEMKTLYVLDASGFLYSCYFAIRNMTNSQGRSTNAIFGFIRSVQKLFKDFHPSHFVAVFDGPNNAKKRLEIYADYKAHRSSMPPDLYYQIEWAQEFCDLIGIPKLIIPGVEADDTMGSVAKWAAELGAVTYLCTTDKDMYQMVNDKIFILNARKDNLILDSAAVKNVFGVRPDQIIDYLSIVGDASDNIPGLPGFGPKTAAQLLQEFDTLENILSNPNALMGKKKETILQEGDKARLSKKLVTLDTNVEFIQDPHFFHLKSIQFAPLKEFYANLNFHSLSKELEQLRMNSEETSESEQKNETAQYTLIDDEEALKTLISYLSKQKEVCFEIECTSEIPTQSELVGIAFSIEPKIAFYIPGNGKLGLQRVLESVKPLLENQMIGFYGHNVKNNYHILSNYGIKLKNISFDTILASYILNSHSRQHSLEFLCLEFFGKVKTTPKELLGKGKNEVSLYDVPLPLACNFSCESVDYTLRLKGLLEKQLEERNLQSVYKKIELPLLLVLANMERNGIFLDIEQLKQTSEQIIKEIRNLESTIHTLAGEEFNINSPKQLIQIFEKLNIKLPKTKTGFTTNADALEDLKNTYPIAERLLEYRTLEKLRSTYLESLSQDVDIKTKRIHCTFNQFVAATGRLSCQDPNLQNIPVRSEIGLKIREAFRPEKKGWSYLAGDYSQIELRLLAHFSEDPIMMSAFNNNEDIHAHTASVIFDVPLKEVTKQLRYQAKTVNFGIIYGQQSWGLARELNIPEKEARAFIEMYFQRYKRVKEFVEESKKKARETQKAVTFTGRERSIPEINSSNYNNRLLAERLAVNTPLQGSAADLIKMAMLKIEQILQKEKFLGYMILQIHDELIFEIPDFEIITFEHLVREAMQSVIKLKIPLVVDISVGKNWKEC
jgi:DNA polymerase I